VPAKKADPVRERAVELGKRTGCRGVVEALAKEGHVVGKTAVAEWLRQARQAKAGKAPPRAQRPRKAPAPAPASTPSPAASPAPPTAPEPDDDDDLDEADVLGADPAALDFIELLKLDQEVTRFLRQAAKAGEERRYGTFARLKLEVRTALEKMRPAPKVDPDKDPLSLAAREAVFAKLKKMVSKAKAVPLATS
jgi:hypothetical protein